VVTGEEIRRFAEEHGLPCVEVSALDQTNLEATFISLIL